MFIMFNMHVHVCMHAYMCVHAWDTLTHPYTHPHTPNTPTRHPPGGTSQFSKNTITFELIKIFQFRLKI